MAAEFAERFALDHLAMDDAFWTRLHGRLADDELADLTMCCGMFLGLGRVLAVIGVRAPRSGFSSECRRTSGTAPCRGPSHIGLCVVPAVNGVVPTLLFVRAHR